MGNLPRERERLARLGRLREPLLRLAERRGTPLYVFDAWEARRNLDELRDAFAAAGAPIRPFFAMKSNHYPGLLKTLVREGCGLDASSVRELELAVAAGAREIVYTGPAKTERDLARVLRHRERVIVHLESERELRLLGRMTGGKRRIRCAIRVYTGREAGWSKFGVPLERFGALFRAAREYPGLDLRGVQFHMSRAGDARRHAATLRAVARHLSRALSRAEREELEFVDIGGGYFPQVFEGIYTWNESQRMRLGDMSRIHRMILDDRVEPRWRAPELPAISEVASAVAEAYREEVRDALPNAVLYAEPGRWISHSVMHLLFRVVDDKEGRFVITDGAGNMVGWEKYQYYRYAPIFNLTSYSPRRETPCLVYGSLCTPDDVWGYYVRGGRRPREGDLLVMPFQGAYTYSLAQSFIRAIPEVADLDVAR